LIYTGESHQQKPDRY